MADKPYVLSPFDRIVDVHFGGLVVIAEVPSFVYLNPLDPAAALPPSSWSADGKPYAIFDKIPRDDYKDAWVWQPFDSAFQVYQLLPFESIEEAGQPVPPYPFGPREAYQVDSQDVVSGSKLGAAAWIETAPFPADWYFTTYNGSTPTDPGGVYYNGALLQGNSHGEPPTYVGQGRVWVYQIKDSFQAWSVGLIVNMSKVKLVAVTQSDNYIPTGYLPSHGVNLKCYDGGAVDLSITTGGFIRATLPVPPRAPGDPPPELVDAVPIWQRDVAPLLDVPAGPTEIGRFNSAGVV